MTEHAQQAADLLGSDHPVSRLAETIHAVRRQTAVCISFTLALALLSWRHPTRSLPLTASAVLVDLLLVGAWAVLRTNTQHGYAASSPLRPKPAADRGTERDDAIARHAFAPTTGDATTTRPRLRGTLERTTPGPAATAPSRARAGFRAGSTGGSVAAG